MARMNFGQETGMLIALREDIKTQLSNPSWIILQFMFTLGIMSVIAQFESSIPLLDRFFDFTRETLPNTGRFLRLLATIVIGLFLYRVLIAVVTGEFKTILGDFNFLEFAATLLIVFGLVALVVYMPALFPQLFSQIPPAINSIWV